MLTQARLKELLHYNPDTGVFTWISSGQGVRKSKIAGYRTKEGLIQIRVDYVLYKAHRLAFLYMEGYFPEHDIDHKFGIKDDNRWSKIAHVSHACNLQNCKKRLDNTSGFQGVSLNKLTGKWVAGITIKGEQYHLGLHTDVVSAALARITFEDQCEKWHCDHRQVNRVKLREMGYAV